jgi:hypothetical protein
MQKMCQRFLANNDGRAAGAINRVPAVVDAL